MRRRLPPPEVIALASARPLPDAREAHLTPMECEGEAGPGMAGVTDAAGATAQDREGAAAEQGTEGASCFDDAAIAVAIAIAASGAGNAGGPSVGTDTPRRALQEQLLHRIISDASVPERVKLAAAGGCPLGQVLWDYADEDARQGDFEGRHRQQGRAEQTWFVSKELRRALQDLRPGQAGDFDILSDAVINACMQMLTAQLPGVAVFCDAFPPPASEQQQGESALPSSGPSAIRCTHHRQ